MVCVERDRKDAWFFPVSPDHREGKCTHDAFPPFLPREMGNKMGADKVMFPFLISLICFLLIFLLCITKSGKPNEGNSQFSLFTQERCLRSRFLGM